MQRYKKKSTHKNYELRFVHCAFFCIFAKIQLKKKLTSFYGTTNFRNTQRPQSQ
jgi:hypothetical protein